MNKHIIILTTTVLLLVISSNLNAQHNKTKWMDGDWYGIGYQPNANNAQAWDIYLYYDLKSKSFLISYPDFPCSGHWKLVKANKHNAEFIEYINAGGGEIYACKLAMDMFGVKREDLVDEVKDVLTVGKFYAKCGGQGTQIIFI